MNGNPDIKGIEKYLGANGFNISSAERRPEMGIYMYIKGGNEISSSLSISGRQVFIASSTRERIKQLERELGRFWLGGLTRKNRRIEKAELHSLAGAN